LIGQIVMLETYPPPTIDDSLVIAFAIAAILYLAFARHAGEHRNVPGLIGLLGAIVWAMPQTRAWSATIADPAALRALLNLFSRPLHIGVLRDCGSWPRWYRRSPRQLRRVHASAVRKNSVKKDHE
jgi:hypothetical protein